ncbi:MAG: transcription antitermination protein NusB [Bacilli bacterium]|nr:transcription antitermination protein NusB [Bacilli bacterium]
MELTRNEAQELALSVIYDTLILDELNIGYDLQEVICDVLNEENFDEADIFVKTIVVKALINKQDIINKINPFLINWKWDRLSRLMQAILILSVTHYYYIGDVDKAIVINVAVKLCKKFIDIDKDEQHKFVNGILDKILQ